jgi:hypothetical protein
MITALCHTHCLILFNIEVGALYYSPLTMNYLVQNMSDIIKLNNNQCKYYYYYYYYYYYISSSSSSSSTATAVVVVQQSSTTTTTTQ